MSEVETLKPGEFIGDGIPRTAGGLVYDPLEGITDPEDAFWLSCAPLEEIRRYARSQGIRVNPWALLDAVLARLSVAIPPNVVIDPLDSRQPSPLNLYVALLGGSGTGKGITERAAQTLIPGIRGALTHAPASGEGIPTMFASRQKNEDGSSFLKPVAMRALLSVPEVTPFGQRLPAYRQHPGIHALVGVFGGADRGGQPQRDGQVRDPTQRLPVKPDYWGAAGQRERLVR
ncbi:MAG: YfjI family protein [Bifidobacterium sp.]|nr:YfjI family protein [Bifidobacterium sp.]